MMFIIRKTLLYIHAALYGMFFHAFMQAVWQVEGCPRYDTCSTHVEDKKN